MDRSDYLQYEKALARRGYAALCDYFFFFVVCYVYFLFFSTRVGNGLWTLPLFPHGIIFSILWCVWFPYMESLNGFTIFKAIFGVRVVNEEGSSPRFSSTFIRHLFDPIDLFLFFGIVGVILSKVTAKHQRIGDMVAHTHVIKINLEDPHETTIIDRPDPNMHSSDSDFSINEEPK